MQSHMPSTAHILCLVALLALSCHQALAQFDAQSEGVAQQLPATCIPTSSASQFGWIGALAASNSATRTIIQEPATITLEYGAWASAHVSTLVAALLLRDIMGVNVKLVEYAGSTGTFERLDRGTSDVNLEVWPALASIARQYNQYVVQSGRVADLGMVGYPGKVSWYVNQRVSDTNPTLIFDSWRSFQRQQILNFLPTVGTTAPGRHANGTFLCDTSLYPWCTNGIFVPPQCQGSNLASCREFWTSSPTYSMGENEQRIISLNLKLVVVYLTPQALATKVNECAAQSQTLCVFHHWAPEPIVSANAVARVNLPEFSSSCYSNFTSANVNRPENSLKCDWPSQLMLKLGSPTLAKRAPVVASFFRFFTIRELDIDNLLGDVARMSASSAAAVGTVRATVACQWINQNRIIWESWIVKPPIDYIRYLESLNPSQVLPLVALLLCILHLLLCTFSAGILFTHGRPLSKLNHHHSRPVMALVLVASLLPCLAVIIEVLSPLTSQVCTSLTYLPSIGQGLVAASLATKAWHVHFVHGNKRLTLAPSPRMLAITCTTMAALNVLILAIWHAVDGAAAVRDVDVGPTSFTTVCVYPRAVVGNLAAALLALVHFGAWIPGFLYAYRVRKVQLPGGDAWHPVLAAGVLAVAYALRIPELVLSYASYREAFAIRAYAAPCTMMVIVYLVVTRPVLVLHWHRKGGKAAAGGGSSAVASVSGSKRASTARGGFQSDGSLEDGVGGSVATAAAAGRPRATSTRAGTESTGMVKEEPITSLMTRIGAAYNIQNMSGVVRQWEEVNLILFHSPCASLLILPTKDLKSQGQVYVCGVQAAKMDAKLSLSFPNSFLLCINTDSYVVQAKDAADAEKWVQDIEATFKPVNAISQSAEQTARQRSLTSKHTSSQSQSQVAKSRKASNAGNV